MLNLPKNVWILTGCQSLFMSLSVFMVFVAGIIGSELAPTKSLSTLPVATIVVGTAEKGTTTWSRIWTLVSLGQWIQRHDLK